MKLKLKRRKKQNQRGKAEQKDKNHKSTSKTNKPGAKHFKLDQKNLVDKKIEHKLKEKEKNRKSKTTKRR